MKDKKVTLTELLESRENRVHHQKELIAEFDGVLVSVTLNIPGPVKDSALYRSAMECGMKRLLQKLEEAVSPEQVLHREIRFLVTGPEGYVALDSRVNPEMVKALTVEIEESSRLGRIFDMDVLTYSDGKLVSISRNFLGGSPRKCLLCGDDAKVCARSQKHELSDLLREIDSILKESGING